VEKNDQRLKGFQGLPSRLSGKLCTLTPAKDQPSSYSYSHSED
jgi:hypothetical protein